MDTNSDYYQSHLKLDFIAASGQERLSKAKVLVIGAGGLGCPCLSALAACGIGTIGIADGDRVSLSNLPRQTLFNFSDTGNFKTSAAIESLKNRNPYIRFNEHRYFINEENILSLVETYDIIADATDNFHARYLINDACAVKGKSLVYGAIFRTEGHLTVFNHLNSPTLRCLFPEPENEDHIPSCADIGAYAITTSIIGTMMANEVLKIALENKDVLSGKLLTLDTLSGRTTVFSYAAREDSRNKSFSRFTSPDQNLEVSAEEFLARMDEVPAVLLIDVREADERESFDIGGIHIPLDDLENFDLNKLSASQNLYFYCQNGVKSLQSAKYFRKKGFKNAFSLKGGLKNLKNLI